MRIAFWIQFPFSTFKLNFKYKKIKHIALQNVQDKVSLVYTGKKGKNNNRTIAISQNNKIIIDSY